MPATLEVPDPSPPEAPTGPPGGPEIPGDPTPPEQPAETPPAPEVPDPQPPVEPEPGEPDVPSPDPTGPEIPDDPQPPEPDAEPPGVSRLRAESTPEQSDQLPEEGPGEQVPDDVGDADEGAARESSSEHAREQSHDPPSERGYRDDAEQEAYEERAGTPPDAADEEVGGG